MLYFCVCVQTEAFAYGLKYYDNHAIEFDVQLSGDNVPMLIHDAKLGRTVKDDGYVVDYSAKELGNMNAGQWHSDRFGGATIPRYEDVVAFCRGNDIWMNVEVKGDFSDGEHLRKIGTTVASLTKALFKDEMAKDTIDYSKIPIISSFSVEALEGMLAVAPEFPRALLVRGIGDTEGFISDTDELCRLLEHLEASACHINAVGLLKSHVAPLLARGYTVMAYNVDCPKRAMELEGYGINTICSDNFNIEGDIDKIKHPESRL